MVSFVVSLLVAGDGTGAGFPELQPTPKQSARESTAADDLEAVDLEAVGIGGISFAFSTSLIQARHVRI
jgi:hypothetical protein